MDHNKFIYKINKYKYKLRNKDSKNLEIYKQKIDAYYEKLNEMLNTIKNNQKGGDCTDADLPNFLQSTIDQIEGVLNQTVKLTDYEAHNEETKKNHNEILNYVKQLDLGVDALTEENTEFEKNIKELSEKIKALRTTTETKIRAKLPSEYSP